MDALDILMKYDSAVFFTLTTPDEVDVEEIRARWCFLRHRLLRELRKKYGKAYDVQYVMNYEAHPGYLQKIVKDPKTVDRVIHGTGRSHGWHIHGVINCFVSLARFRALIIEAGFGRVDVRRVNSSGVADYLTKHALKAYAGLSARERQKYVGIRLRLVNTSRGLPPLNAYAWQSSLIDRTRNFMSELRAIEDKEVGLVFRDYRRLHLRAQVCSLLNLGHAWQLSRVFEALSEGQRVHEIIERLKWRDIFGVV